MENYSGPPTDCGPCKSTPFTTNKHSFTHIHPDTKMYVHTVCESRNEQQKNVDILNSTIFFQYILNNSYNTIATNIDQHII